MAYTKTNWVNGQTPINATNLNKIENGIADLYNAIFPIGQIVIKGDDVDYSNWLGFTWERTAVGKVLVGYDNSDTDFNTIGKTGGEKTHTLTPNEMPEHSHETYVGTDQYQPGSSGEWIVLSGNGTKRGTTSNGGDQPHNNLQPYQVVAYWKRTS